MDTSEHTSLLMVAPSNTSVSSYVGKVMLGSFPKMLIIIFCIIIAAYTTEITFATTVSSSDSGNICYNNPKAITSGGRICQSLMGVAISSILVCMVLMTLDVFIPCVDIKFRRLAYIFSLVFSLIMGIALLVASSMVTNLYVKYCNYIKDHDDPFIYPPKCGKNERPFVILPVFGFLTMAAWGFNGMISLLRAFLNN